MSTAKNKIAKNKGPLLFIHTFEWLNDWLPNQGISSYTIRSYRSALKNLGDYINNQGLSIAKFLCSDLTSEFVRQWMLWQRDQNENKPSSINTKLTALKSYLEYAVAEDFSLQSVYLKIKQVKPLKSEKRIKTVLTHDQIQLLLDVIPNNKKAFRDRVMILLMYESACRLSELVKIKLHNVSTEPGNPFVKVDGKGKKQRVIPLSDDMAGAITTYIDLFHNEDTPATDLLFYTTYNGQPTEMNVRTFQVILDKYAKLAKEQNSNFPDKIHPHMLRRSRATHLYQSDMPFETVSSMLGHEQLETTRVYAVPSLRQMREAMEQGVIKGHDEEPTWQAREEIMAKFFGLKNTKFKHQRSQNS